MNIKELLEYGRNNLIEKKEPYRLSKTLLNYLLKVQDNYLIMNENELVNIDIEKKFKESIKLLNNGIPIQYITKHQEFMKMNFYVDKNVLIPQPDTEILVEEVIKLYKTNTAKFKVLDLCTGSGAIGISIANYLQNSEVTMSDISLEALKIAKKNALNNNIKNKCKFIHSNMFKNIQKKFDIIVSNPPYIRTNIIPKLDKEVQNEPFIALNGGKDGLLFYKIIAEQAHIYLKNKGILALEIGYDPKEKVIELLTKEKKYKDIYSKKDLCGNDRIIVCKKGEDKCHSHQI